MRNLCGPGGGLADVFASPMRKEQVPVQISTPTHFPLPGHLGHPAAPPGMYDSSASGDLLTTLNYFMPPCIVEDARPRQAPPNPFPITRAPSSVPRKDSCASGGLRCRAASISVSRAPRLVSIMITGASALEAIIVTAYDEPSRPGQCRTVYTGQYGVCVAHDHVGRLSRWQCGALRAVNPSEGH